MSSFKILFPAIVLLIIGFCATIIGALFKIQHWIYGSHILGIGILTEGIGILVFLIALKRIYRANN